MPKVSVVIPCYNQGAYLDEAVESVLAQTFTDYEIIIVDDGSTDAATTELLQGYSRPATRVLRTANRGPSAARNHGIREASGNFILPLDGDDRIAPRYLEKAVAVLERDPQCRIVYCKAEMFGARSGPWPSPDFSLQRMLLGNLIFCSAVFRRSDWEETGGYSPGMTAGYEDWDFWLSILELGGGVYRIPETLFFYRIKETSRTTGMDAEKKAEMHLQIIRNHKELFIENARPLLELYYRISESLPYRLLKKMRLPYLIGSWMGGR